MCVCVCVCVCLCALHPLQHVACVDKGESPCMVHGVWCAQQAQYATCRVCTLRCAVRKTCRCNAQSVQCAECAVCKWRLAASLICQQDCQKWFKKAVLWKFIRVEWAICAATNLSDERGFTEWFGSFYYHDSIKPVGGHKWPKTSQRAKMPTLMHLQQHELPWGPLWRRIMPDADIGTPFAHHHHPSMLH